MRVAVCIKVVSDPEGGVGAGAIEEINPHDLPALRFALELRDHSQGRLAAYSATERPAETLLRRVLLSGADEAHLIRPCSNTSFRHREALRAIAELLNAPKPDVILCGFESLDNMQGKFGAELAHVLGYEIISQVVELSGLKGDQLELERVVAPGWVQRIRCAAPVVLSTIPYSPADASRLKLPLIPERIGEALHVHTWTSDSAVAEPNPLEHQPESKLRLAMTRERPLQPPDLALAAPERMAAIYGLRGLREGTTLTGTPGEISDRFIAILNELKKGSLA